MSTNYLKNFAEGETIRASETNANNQFLLNKISDNASDIQLTVQTQISNVKSELATTKNALQTQIETKLDDEDKEKILNWLIPDWTKVTNISASSYTCPSIGWIKARVRSVQHTSAGITVNGVYMELAYSSGNYIETGNILVPVSKNDVVSCRGTETSYSFIPMKGVN